ncbi:aquaporin [Candidatus Dependentiae bacterium]|nr:aquaporin [Candidatus Dependentiae bacterium]
MKKYIVECFGTMFLVLAISLTGNPIAIGTMLAVIMYLGAHISGGHYNPAVTLAIWLRGKLKSKDVLYYMFFQVLGGFFAAAIYWFLADQRYYPAPAAGVSYPKVFAVELIFTFFLAFVVLVVMTTKKVKLTNMFGLVIGFALMTIAFLGGTYNPAVSLGPSLFDLIFGGSAITHVPVYLLGTFSGGGLAALAYRYIHCEEFK